MKEQKILVTGSSGLVASRFVELYPFPHQLATPDLPDFDITNSEKVKSEIKKFSPHTIIHFAAYTDVTAAESNQDICQKINVEGTQNLLNAAKTVGAALIFISTDMGFPGDKDFPGPYSETRTFSPDPKRLTWYGYTKAMAEETALRYGAPVVRINYPVRAHFPKLDFFRKFLYRFDQHQELSLFTDQQITITFIDELCHALQIIIDRRLTGIFHVASSDSTTPYDLISYLLKKVRHVENVVQPASLTSVSDSRRYPQFGGLKSEETQKQLGMQFRTCHQIIDELIKQGIGN